MDSEEINKLLLKHNQYNLFFEPRFRIGMGKTCGIVAALEYRKLRKISSTESIKINTRHDIIKSSK